MKSLAFSLCAVCALVASSGCCCFWHNVNSAFNCRGGGPGNCGGCGHSASCGGGCSQGCGDSCGGGCSHGCGGGGCGGGGFSLLGSFFGYHGNYDGGCNILGCGSHYLDPQGACYGADCGSCCQKAGCGCMYWGDYFNVPPTTEPCDCCQNYVGPSHSPYGSTPCYYGPAPGYQAANCAAGVGAVTHEGAIVAEKTITKTPASSEVVVNSPSPEQTASPKKVTPMKTASRPMKKQTRR